jgi:hypothetical protein
MYDFIWFIILLILIAASVALVFLILFGESARKGSVHSSDINNAEKNRTEINTEKTDAELIKKLRLCFSDKEICRIVKICSNAGIMHDEPY